jgi:hypothetical protein
MEKYLENKGYCKKDGDVLIVRPAFTDVVFPPFDVQFAELIATYPAKVGTPGNWRTLHALDSSALSLLKVRTKYKSYLDKDPTLHRTIIDLLKIQLKNQRQKLQYLPGLEVWVNQRKWEEWEGIEDIKDSTDGRNVRVFD